MTTAALNWGFLTVSFSPWQEGCWHTGGHVSGAGAESSMSRFTKQKEPEHW